LLLGQGAVKYLLRAAWTRPSSRGATQSRKSRRSSSAGTSGSIHARCTHCKQRVLVCPATLSCDA